MSFDHLFSGANRAQKAYQEIRANNNTPSGYWTPPGQFMTAMRFVPKAKKDLFDEISISTPHDNPDFEMALFKNNRFVKSDPTYSDTVASFGTLEEVIEELRRLCN